MLISVYRNDRFHRPSMVPRARFPAAGGAGKQKNLSRVREVCARVEDDGVRPYGVVRAVTADRRACCQ
ncbi:predicted protein [Streptomyces viridosporus ATCC 14672]|uniref:Predicted protein n=1 Tax=Streptomyces viridosporus (strain ATCC 14672 / DSM 40746 / JCM 4963 / KCTC 9882 / NRRL B-12104 / FH 1290) TaxID=566461 RepID=D5ZVV0_STRV1|nr:predicted protein [Streptomyces viridosporus ATCC 14672]